jgi:hypothetical protein
MLSELQVGRQKIRYDHEATLALYRNTVTMAGADTCDCLYCQNYAAQRDKVFPKEFCDLLEKLGVNPLREWEAFDYDEIGPSNPKIHSYGGWFLFVGELVEGFDEKLGREPSSSSYLFTTSFPTGTLPKDTSICAVNFIADVPWILSLES